MTLEEIASRALNREPTHKNLLRTMSEIAMWAALPAEDKQVVDPDDYSDEEFIQYENLRK